MPPHHGLGADDDQGVLPTRPEPVLRDPESTIKRAEPRPGTFLRIRRELLSECQLDNRLFLAGPEEGEQDAK